MKRSRDWLKKALRYDPRNPIANYRLAFLSYKREIMKKRFPILIQPSIRKSVMKKRNPL